MIKGADDENGYYDWYELFIFMRNGSISFNFKRWLLLAAAAAFHDRIR